MQYFSIKKNCKLIYLNIKYLILLMTEEHLYANLFTLRLTLQDENYDELNIIKKLKYLILDNGISFEQINEKLFDFYNNFGIEITLPIIESVVIDNIPIQSIFNVIMNSSVQPMNVHPIQNLFGIILNHAFNIPQHVNNDVINNNDDIDTDEVNNEINNEINHVFPTGLMGPPSWFHQLDPFNNVNTDNVPVQLQNINLPGDLLNVLFGNIQPPQFHEDVVVTVDDEDADNLKSFKIEEQLESDCCICMGPQIKDEMSTELLCKHTFHTECIQPYVRQYGNKCPVCRTEIGRPKYNNL